MLISGELPIGAPVPPERELAPILGVSRPVVHQAMAELSAKGFVRVEPRRGAVVRDFFREGTLAVYEAMALHGAAIPEAALRDALAFRRLVEADAARLAAERRGGEYLPELEATRKAAAAEPGADSDFAFHIAAMRASGSVAHPLVINSLRGVYTVLVARFFERLGDSAEALSRLDHMRGRVVEAIRSGEPLAAAEAMGELLDHGADVLGIGPGSPSA